APLYYALLAPLAALLPDDPPGLLHAPPNPYTGYRFDQPGNDNKNVVLHTADEAFPYPDRTARAVHLLRLTSPLLGGVTVALAFGIFGLLWPRRPDMQLVGTAVVAFWPSLLYIFSVLNNDC